MTLAGVIRVKRRVSKRGRAKVGMMRKENSTRVRL